MSEGSHKPPKPFFPDTKPFNNVFCRHPGNPSPDPFVDFFCSGLAELLSDIDEPEGIDYPVMPEKKFKVLLFIGISHRIKDSKVHFAHAGSPETPDTKVATGSYEYAGETLFSGGGSPVSGGLMSQWQLK
jgi:hypothetical protein